MEITKITLKNFRQFEGNHIIDLSTNLDDVDQKVIFVDGDNTTGKTTLEKAFLWCFFGGEYDLFDDKLLLSKNIQKKMLDDECENDEKETFVVIEFKNKDQSCTLTRKQRYCIKNKAKREVCPESNVENYLKLNVNYKNEYGCAKNYDPVDLNAQTTINKLIPKELADYFFFQGEGITKIAKSVNKSLNNSDEPNEEFKKAVEKIVGLEYLNKAIRHLGEKKKGVIDLINNEIKKRGKQNNILEDLYKKIEEEEKSIEKNNEKISVCNKEISQYESVIRNNESEFMKLEENKVIAEKINSARKNLDTIKSDIDNCFKNIKNEFNLEKTKKWILSKLCKGIEENKILGNTSNLDASVEFIDSLLECGKCICGRELTEEDISFFKKMKNSLKSQEFTNLINLFKIQISEVKNNGFTLDEIESYKTKISEKYTKYREIQNELENYDESVFASNDSKRTKLKEEENNAKESIEYHKTELAMLLEKNKKSKSNLENYKNELYEECKKSEETKQLIHEYNYACAVLKKLQDEYESESLNTREKFTNKINELFGNVFESELRLEVSEKYDLKLINSKTNERIDNSEGQGDVIVFCFITAIQYMTFDDGINYPLIMDAPFSNLDKDRIRKVCNMLADNFQQLVLFINNVGGEVACETLQNHICKTYSLKKLSDVMTEIIEY